jgi:HEAT repeat protein
MPLVRKPVTEAATAPTAAPELAADLRDGTTAQRWTAARVLGDTPDGIPALAEALSCEPDPHVREAIFTSLARLASPAGLAAVLPHLRAEDATMRTAALDALRAMPAVVHPILPALLVDADPDIRILSCDLARDLPSAEATSLLCGVLDRDPHPNVCAAALDVLADIGDATDAATLVCFTRCASRFPDDRFLAFAVKVAIGRIAAQAPDGHG